MKLKKFKERDNKRIGIIVFTLVCILLVSGVILYRTFAIFEVKTNQNVIKGTVQGMGDIEFAFYIDDKIVKSIPDTKEDYVFDEESSTCTNGASVYWDYQEWGPLVKNLKETKTKCYLKFKKEYNEEILNGAVPKLKEDLIPVTIDTDGTVKKADITTEWYKYGEQKWANAVITRNSYDLLGSNVHGDPKLENDSVHFDGEDDYIDLGLANYEFGNQMTLSVNFIVNAFTESGEQDILTNTESGGVGIIMAKNMDNEIMDNKYHLMIEFADVTSPTYIHLWDDAEIILGQEYNVIFKMDNETLQLYINGNMVKSITSAIKYKLSINPFLLGANPQGNPDSLFTSVHSNINVKQAAIFNRAIDDNEIADISNNFKITNGSGLLKYVDFTNKTYESGEVISEDNIESYFVWIPRYRYQIWNGEEETNQFNNVEELGAIDNATTRPELNKQKEIKIEFENRHVPVSNGTLKNQWLTHPAFTSFDSNGFWVGKFETGYKGATQATDAEQNIQDASKVIIKPNVYSWRDIEVANAFYTTKKYEKNLDSHMMKNSEWGAVTYLTNSKYGRCSDKTCEEVRINNNSDYITGNSAKEAPTCGYTGSNLTCNHYGTDSNTVNSYNNPLSTESSTTGNYYGVFDMAGGAWEYVMGVMTDQNGNPVSGINNTYNSRFVGALTYPKDCSDPLKTEWTLDDGGLEWPDKKYYDTYLYDTTEQHFQRGLYGDGTKEFGPFYKLTYEKDNGVTNLVSSWNADEAFFVYHEFPWFTRGGFIEYGTDAGIQAFRHNGGNGNIRASFRIILTP